MLLMVGCKLPIAQSGLLAMVFKFQQTIALTYHSGLLFWGPSSLPHLHDADPTESIYSESIISAHFTYTFVQGIPSPRTVFTHLANQGVPLVFAAHLLSEVPFPGPLAVSPALFHLGLPLTC